MRNLLLCVLIFALTLFNLRGQSEEVELQLGNDALKARAFDVAIIHFSEALRLNPANPHLFNNRGVAHKLKGEHDKAIQDFSAAIRISEIEIFYENRGDCFKVIGNLGRAVDDYTAAIRLRPNDAPVLFKRAEAYEANNEYEKAIDDWTLSSTMNAKLSWVSFMSLARILATCPKSEIRYGEKAVAYAKKACELAGWESASRLDTLASAYAEAGDFDSAIKWEKKLLELPKLSAKLSEAAAERLKLYEAHKPYHAEK